MKVISFAKQNVVLCVAALAAFFTAILVPPDLGYLDYIDWRTMICLFLTLSVICALRNIRFFYIISRKIVKATGSLRMLALSLIIITFIGSMLIANDMALITFLPLGYFALTVTKNQRYMAYIFILQNISANLGGMLTPFGNPQNLYLYSFFNIPNREFIAIMFPPFLLAIAMLAVCCLLLPRQPLTIEDDAHQTLNTKKAVLYLTLFAFSLLIVFRIIPGIVGLILIPIILFIVDRDALKAVDYPLLATFFFFFIFSGNMSRIKAVSDFVSGLLQRSTLLVSVVSCQCISNVPSAILLSQFTQNYHDLLLGVNIGGTGTLIASLASLITFSQFKALNPGHGKKYFLLFTLLNTVFLLVLTTEAYLFF